MLKQQTESAGGVSPRLIVNNLLHRIGSDDPPTGTVGTPTAIPNGYGAG